METRKRKDLDHSASRRSVIPQAFCCVHVCLSTQVYKLLPVNVMVGLPCDGPASHLWRGEGGGVSGNSRSRFMLRKPNISVGSMEHIAQCRLNYLRNRKHLPCFYGVIHVETRVEVWKNEKCCENTSRRRVFHSFFEFSQTFTTVSVPR